MEADLLGQGLELMLVGMAVVFVFLTVLVGATALMSRVVMRFQPPPSLPPVGEEEIAAISAAIARHRGKQRD
jgi:oxaloacetate decarboxylase gamma subunit